MKWLMENVVQGLPARSRDAYLFWCPGGQQAQEGFCLFQLNKEDYSALKLLIGLTMAAFIDS